MSDKKEFVESKVVKESTVQTSGHDIFTLVTKDGVVMIAIADKIVSRNSFASEEEAIKYIESKPWELIINVSCVCFDLVQKQSNNK